MLETLKIIFLMYVVFSIIGTFVLFIENKGDLKYDIYKKDPSDRLWFQLIKQIMIYSIIAVSWITFIILTYCKRFIFSFRFLFKKGTP